MPNNHLRRKKLLDPISSKCKVKLKISVTWYTVGCPQINLAQCKFTYVDLPQNSDTVKRVSEFTDLRLVGEESAHVPAAFTPRRSAMELILPPLSLVRA